MDVVVEYGYLSAWCEGRGDESGEEKGTGGGRGETHATCLRTARALSPFSSTWESQTATDARGTCPPFKCRSPPLPLPVAFSLRATAPARPQHNAPPGAETTAPRDNAGHKAPGRPHNTLPAIRSQMNAHDHPPRATPRPSDNNNGAHGTRPRCPPVHAHPSCIPVAHAYGRGHSHHTVVQ